ncbi:hypothetical protein SHL15_8382 [Streptomyces hygroscopicus subsp. limoneus]|nr:hypothetical protein SHL15_8382 [Streptomyces hygroscopicus subsp. limoneus]
MTRRNQPGGPPAAAAPPGQPHVRRAVALPLYEGDVDGAAVSEALTRGGTTAAEAVAQQSVAQVRPLVTAVPAAAVRAEAEVAARTFRPHDGRTGAPDAATGGQAAPGRPTSPSGRSGHWPLMAAAAVAGAVLVSVPLLSGGEKKTTGADALDPVAIAGARHGSGGPTSAPVPDGSAGADVTFPAPTSAPRAGVPSALPGGRHGSATRVATGHGDKAVEQTGAREPGGHGPSPSSTAGAPHGRYAGPHGDGTGPRTKPVDGSVSLLSAPASSVQRAAQARVPSSAGAARHTSTRTAAAVSDVKTARKPQTATTASHTAAVRTTHPRTTSAARQTQPQSHQRTSAQAGTQTGSQSHTTTQRHWSTKVVNATYVLHSGESVASDRMRITMRTGGDLVISDEHGTVRWSSHTHGSGNYAVFQDDGNLAVYSANHTSLWTSGTAGNAGAELVIQNDGNVVILSRSGHTVWAAGTAH